ncbi:hypothetical protein [Tenuibacillus multivorans]|uniref:Uncharacterized protein n=1 Tax=Tenuibacillus multivorans TaxID=237069 RepID=A0A1G9WC64_9BACI|nr:hypothetical protein [Tenuibacillus multivorans]GEL76399.1 hypothetical protein TMU01_06340 [Tenuibacillus multivorans]SDM82164.1 hypothetical protein SAMN05216498_0689 [Tenuibacillus multivorans]
MANKKLALAATGKDEVAFESWAIRAVGKENAKKWSSGKNLLEHLVQASSGGQDCIDKLYIFSHAWPYDENGNRGGVKIGGPDINGFYLDRRLYDHNDARYLNDLIQLIRAGKVKFCSAGEVYLTGCRVASSPFPQYLARVTGSTIYAANGSSFPKPGNPPGDKTGEWISGVDLWEEQQAAKKGLYVGWLKYRYDSSTQQVTEEKVGQKTSKGYVLDIW